MAGMSPTRIISFLLVAVCAALCQQPDRLVTSNPLPDAPSLQTPSRAESFRAYADTARVPVTTLTTADGQPLGHYDPGHFVQKEPVRSEPDELVERAALINHTHSYHASTSSSFLGRAAYAASSIVLTRDESGHRSLNKSYLLAVLTTAAADTAHRPYWKRSVTQPFSDVGSTVGSDAGMNVFHEFEPGILQLVKNHQPKLYRRLAPASAADSSASIGFPRPPELLANPPRREALDLHHTK